MATITHFRDVVVLDAALAGQLKLDPGDTLVAGARELTLKALVSGYNYVLAADTLTVAADAKTTLLGTGQAPSPKVIVIARELRGALNVVCRGATGAQGKRGTPGPDSYPIPGEFHPLHEMGGGPGGTGEPGSRGGAVHLRFASAATPPLAEAPGGPGGAGGKGGVGGTQFQAVHGEYYPVASAPDGPDGAAGPAGPEGEVVIVQVPDAMVFGALDPGVARAWAAYRAEVAQYLFRRFDYPSQLAAIAEFRRALAVDPENARARLGLSRIVQRQTPTGLSRDIDLRPDFPALAAAALPEVALVQGVFVAVQNAADTDELLQAFAAQVGLTLGQLQNEQKFAQREEKAALQEVKEAQAQVGALDAQMAQLRARIDEAQSFSFGDFISTLGQVAGTVSAIAGGAGAIVSIPASIAAVVDDLEEADGIEEFLQDAGAQGDLASVGKGLAAIMNGEKGLLNLPTVVSQLSGSDQAGSADLARLAALARDRMVANLRLAQARTKHASLELRVAELGESIQQAQHVRDQLQAESADLRQAEEVLLASARLLADRVMDDAFLACRALEIYQLDTPFPPRFDYGYLHPDDDRDLPPATRAARCLVALARLPLDLMAATQAYERLNVTQTAGFDVVHPTVSLHLSGADLLAQLRSTGTAEFSTLELPALPPQIFELKVERVDVDLVGASSADPANVFVIHSGRYVLHRRGDGGSVELALLPRSEVVVCRTANGGLKGQVPAPGADRPSFHGRGVLAGWRIAIEPSAGIDTSQLAEIQFDFGCVGLVTSGTPQPVVEPITL